MSDPATTPVPVLPFPRRRPPAAEPEPLWRELVGQVLRAERRAQARTLRHVADRAGVSVQYLSEVERGLKEPSSELLGWICGALELSLGDLLAASRVRIGFGSDLTAWTAELARRQATTAPEGESSGTPATPMSNTTARWLPLHRPAIRPGSAIPGRQGVTVRADAPVLRAV